MAISGSIALVSQEPLRHWQAAEPNRSASVVINLASRHEKADRASLSIRHRVQFGVRFAVDSADPAFSLIVARLFFGRRLEAVWYILR